MHRKGSSCEERNMEAAAQGKEAESEQRPSPESGAAQLSRDEEIKQRPPES